mgnify:CR=1 FL=1
MLLTLEISLYPLKPEFKSIIKAFINKLQQNDAIKVQANNVSTQISGEYTEIMDLLRAEVKPVLEAQPSVFVIKFLAGDKLS